jgi:hypothetical protein
MFLASNTSIFFRGTDREGTGMGTKRDAYMGKLLAIFEKWNVIIDLMQVKSKNAHAGTRVQYEKQVDGMREKRRDIEMKVVELHKVSGAGWEELKDGLVESRLALGEAMNAVKDGVE